MAFMAEVVELRRPRGNFVGTAPGGTAAPGIGGWGYDWLGWRPTTIGFA